MAMAYKNPHIRPRLESLFKFFGRFWQLFSFSPFPHFLILLSTYLLSSRQKLQVANSLCKILFSLCGQACGVFLGECQQRKNCFRAKVLL